MPANLTKKRLPFHFFCKSKGKFRKRVDRQRAFSGEKEEGEKGGGITLSEKKHRFEGEKSQP